MESNNCDQRSLLNTNRCDSYFSYLNQDILHIFLNYIDYDNLKNLLDSEILKDDNCDHRSPPSTIGATVNYEYLSYQALNNLKIEDEIYSHLMEEDKPYIGGRIKSLNIKDMVNILSLFDFISYHSGSHILFSPSDRLRKSYKLIYMVILKKDFNYLNFLIDMIKLSKLDETLYNLIISNKKFIHFIEIDSLKLGFHNIEELVDDIKNGIDIDDAIFIEHIFDLYYFDNIKEITKYLRDRYGLIRTENFFDNLTDFLANLEKFPKFEDYIIFLIKEYPRSIDIYGDNYLPIYFEGHNQVDISLLILEKIFNHFSNHPDILLEYIEGLLENLWDVNYEDVDVANLYKIADFIGTELAKIENPLFNNVKQSVKVLSKEFFNELYPA